MLALGNFFDSCLTSTFAAPIFNLPYPTGTGIPCACLFCDADNKKDFVVIDFPGLGGSGGLNKALIAKLIATEATVIIATLAQLIALNAVTIAVMKPPPSDIGTT